MFNEEVEKVMQKRFEWLKNRYQNNVESTGGSEFVFDYVHLLYYKCNKTNPNRAGPYIDSPDWMINKKPTINLINKSWRNQERSQMNNKN